MWHVIGLTEAATTQTVCGAVELMMVVFDTSERVHTRECSEVFPVQFIQIQMPHLNLTSWFKRTFLRIADHSDPSCLFFLSQKSLLMCQSNIHRAFPAPTSLFTVYWPEHRAVVFVFDSVIALVFLDALGEAKISNLHCSFVLHQHIPGSQVPVDVILRSQIFHSLKYDNNNSRVNLVVDKFPQIERQHVFD